VEKSLTRAANAAARAGDKLFDVKMKIDKSDYSYRVADSSVLANLERRMAVVNPEKGGLMDTTLDEINIYRRGITPDAGVDPDESRAKMSIHEGIHFTPEQRAIVPDNLLGVEPGAGAHQGPYNWTAHLILREGELK
jgi:hypothetical protein